MSGAQHRVVRGGIDPEKVAYWYFRLNGFFQIENFIVHPKGRGGSAPMPICWPFAFHIARSACSTIRTTQCVMIRTRSRFLAS